ncbi:MAG: heterodisulfide reductase subunit C [Desulfobulbaceae bacterium]|nr:heterodisulfide reductase subunit C [Desulfobulbaceae bacterium]
MIQLGQKDTVLSSKSLAYCVTCETCTARCPNNIDVATVMDVCRHMARRESKFSSWPVRAFVGSFLKTVETFGRAYEAGLMGMYMAATGRLLSDVDLAPKVLARRKLPYTPHSIKGRDEVGAIFKRFREGVHEQK